MKKMRRRKGRKKLGKLKERLQTTCTKPYLALFVLEFRIGWTAQMELVAFLLR